MRHFHANPILLVSNSQLTAFSFAALSLTLPLLIMFMSDTPMIDHEVSLDLPRVSHPRSLWHAQREDALVVAVLRDGNAFFGYDRVAPDMLSSKLREQLPSTRERKVYIRADSRAHWGTVARVVDAVRAAGIWEVAFVTDQRRTTIVQ